MNRAGKTTICLLFLLTILFNFHAPALAQDTVVDEVRSLLETSYVDPVSGEVLDAPTVEEMLELLGDPYTTYFTAEEYQDFTNSLDRIFSGIGIYIDIVPEGVLVISVIEGSPGEEAGLRPGDIIVEADGRNMAGLSVEEAVTILRGPEGSAVELVVSRSEDIFSITVIRKTIVVPTVTGEVLDGHIGYIDIDSFGLNTPGAFGDIVNELKDEHVDGWIVDLRDNPGGYLDSALDIAGYFVGSDIALQIRGRSGATVLYRAAEHSFIINQPVIFLVNEYSASASEILAAAVKDHEKATLVGTGTYGKGTVQSVYTLSDGGRLKMTVARFYSPKGSEINEVGVAPDLVMRELDSLQAAKLLLGSSGEKEDNTGFIQFKSGPNTFEIDLDAARSAEYWPVYKEILNSASKSSELKIGTGSGWKEVTVEPERNWLLFYPDHGYLGELNEVPVDKVFKIRFSGKVDWRTVNKESVELIDIETGERVPVNFQPVSDRVVEAIPGEYLKPGAAYWLVIHDAVRGVNGTRLKQGVLVRVKVGSE